MINYNESVWKKKNARSTELIVIAASVYALLYSRQFHFIHNFKHALSFSAI